MMPGIQFQSQKPKVAAVAPEVPKTLPTGEPAQVGAGGTNATWRAAQCCAGCSTEEGAGTGRQASRALRTVLTPHKSPIHKWVTVTIYSVQSLQRMAERCRSSTCHHCGNLSCKSKGLPNTTTNTCYLKREKTSVYFTVLLSSD